ncbi:hypothetical protein NQ317_008943 [Molorchus minor]|uniref:Uncharacterized protein n=1 Tax=Molorchus minor TaxID=1323400 RepID=A0ABQ9K125_9CUCU|nr:hypothetical protein NQ317_008943 [Molorchus minor]
MHKYFYHSNHWIDSGINCRTEFTMAATTSSFVSDFHNLEGVMIGERIRNFQNLLRNKTILEDEVQSVIDNLQPKTYMENIFYIEILSHYKKTEPLLEILKCGHEAFVKRIMKYDWFFQEAFQNVSAEHLVNDVLPKMSYSVKIKLLNNKLSKILHEDKVDQVFDLVVKRYGLHIALPILSQCSIKRIEDILRNSTTKLSTNQLKIIYKKSPEVIKVYFDQHKQNIDKTIDRKLMTYIAQNNPTFFWELVERYEFNADLKMGRRTTKHLVSSKKERNSSYS